MATKREAATDDRPATRRIDCDRVHVRGSRFDGTLEAPDPFNYLLEIHSLIDSPVGLMAVQTLNIDGAHPASLAHGSEIGSHPDTHLTLIYEPDSRSGGHVTIYTDDDGTEGRR